MYNYCCTMPYSKSPNGTFSNRDLQLYLDEQPTRTNKFSDIRSNGQRALQP